jgi:IS30 family transposase
MAVDQIQNALGDHIEFALLMPNVLTDRGAEFGNPDALEFDKDGNPRTKIYYCDPMRSNQKGYDKKSVM